LSEEGADETGAACEDDATCHARVPSYSLLFPSVDKRSLKQQFLLSEFYLLHKLDMVGIIMLLARGEVFKPALSYLWGELV